MDDAVAAAEKLIPRVVAVEIDVEDVSAMKLQASPERVIYFRNLDSWDIPQVRQLHEEWFPIRYNKAFYDGAAQGLWMETGGPLFARLAVEMQPSTQMTQSSTQVAQSCLEDRRDEHILGAVTASTLPLSKVDDPDLIAPDDWKHTEIMYILTLGTRLSVRRMGIASALLQECIAQACCQPKCGAVYLHVKADNLSARHFYEKNGFQNLRFLQDYYMIDGVRHDAFLYICYVNGAAPQSSWLDLLTRPLLALFSVASFGWKKMIEGFNVDSSKDAVTEKLASTLPSAPVEATKFIPPGASTALTTQLTMNLQDLLDEVEDAMKSPLCEGRGGQAARNNVESISKIAQPTSKSRGNIELDELLNMLSDDNKQPVVAQPRLMQSSRVDAYNSSKTTNFPIEFQVGGTKKCSHVLMDGGRANRGLSTAFSSRNVCSNLRCNDCDFTVVQFPGKKWHVSADYMFFRENVPSETKLRVKMELAPEYAAYACQCKWLSISSQTRVDPRHVKWSCAGH